jgi:hypothetical protein
MDFELRVDDAELELLRDSVRAEWQREHERIAQGINRLHALNALQLKLADLALGPPKATKR